MIVETLTTSTTFMNSLKHNLMTIKYSLQTTMKAKETMRHNTIKGKSILMFMKQLLHFLVVLGKRIKSK
jgi:hypothetical protein